MSYDILPSDAVLDDVANLYPFVSQFWEAIRERGIAAGQDTWAAQAFAYASGTITSATDNGDGTFTVGDSGADWRDSGGNLRWTGATPGAHDVPVWSATTFDIIIDAPDDPSISEVDPRKVIQANISTQPSLSTVTCTGYLADRIAEQVITAAGDLVGRRYWIVRRNGDNWTRGFPDPPNCGAYATGLVTDAATGTLTSASGIQNPDDITSAGAADVVYVGTDGRLQRGTLTGVDGPVITYTGTTALPTVGARFFVGESGGVWIWGATGGLIQSWYGGLVDGYKAHDLDDSVGTAGLPRHTYPVFYGTDSLSCPIDPENVVIKDVDYYVPQDNVCGTGDVYLNPDINKTVRGLWNEGIRLCAFFAEPIDWSGATADPASPTIWAFTPATWMNYAGINGVTGTAGTHSGGSMPCALGVPHTPVNLWWSILDDYGKPILSGYEEDYDGTALTNPLTGSFAAAHDGKDVVASVGPTRNVPLRFGRMYDVVYFIPSLDGDPEGAQLPPSDTFPGTWTVRPASTHYSVPDADGRVGDSTLSRHAIADGDYARYAGDNFADPGLAALLPSSEDQPLATYHNYAYVGARAAATQSAINASLSGTATGGSSVRLVDTSKDWLSVDFYPSGNGRTHSFTAASGSTTGCTVPSVSGTGLWASARFPDFAGPFVGFTVEILMSGSSFSDPAAVIEKRIIATGTAGGVITWAEATSASVDGKAGRIVEPYVLNRWAGYNVHLVRTDAGTVTDDVTVGILGNHDDTLYLDDAGFTIDDKTAFTILAPQVGAVYKRVSGEWVTTADMGDDPRNPGTNPFVSDARFNREDGITEYGLPRPNDETFAFQGGWDELKSAISALKKTFGDTPSMVDDADFSRDASWHIESTWTAYATRVISGDGGGNTNYFLHPSRFRHSATPEAGFTGNLFATWLGSTWGNLQFSGNVIRQSARYEVTPPQSPWPKTVEFYNFATKNSFDTFDANSDEVAENAWTLWDTQSTTTATVTSQTLGSIDPPDEPTAPSTGDLGTGSTVGQPGNASHSKGYLVTAVASLIDWTFKYV